MLDHMHRLTLFLLLTALALACSQKSNLPMTTYDYDAAWLAVKAAQEKGLPQDALSQVDDILNRATNEQHTPQIVKATYTQVALKTSIEPGKTLSLLHDVEKVVDRYDQRSQALLYSYLATAYYSHYQQIQWQINDRTDTSDDLPEDRETWTRRHYYLHIHNLHQKALSYDTELDVDIADYATIITEFDDEGKRLQPTLYLLVGSRAVEFYSSAQSMVVGNADDYQWRDPALMSSTTDFMQVEAPHDSLQVQSVVISTMQRLEQYASDRKYIDAQQYLELERIKAVYQSGTQPNASEVYAAALNRLSSGADDYVASEAKYLLAGHLRKGDVTTTLSIIDDIVESYTEDLPAVAKARNLKHQILQPTLSGRIASTLYPAKEIVLDLSHKNMKSCSYLIYESSYNFRDKYQGWNERENFIAAIKKQNRVASGDITLTQGDAHEVVETTARIKGLAAGQYEVILTGTNEDKGLVGNFHISITVTSLAAQFIHKGDQAFMIVTDRWSGSAISGVKVDYYNRVYNQAKRKNEEILATSNLTDAGGVSTVQDNGNFIPKLTYLGEVYHPNASVNSYVQGTREPRDMVSVMTDRAIYRPGQMLHYKVVAIDVSHSDKKVYERKSVSVELRDANRKEVYTTTLITSEYGSVSGSITLPNDGLPGVYYMVVSVDGSTVTGRRSIRVEEYKRPKFAVVIDSPTDRKVLGDVISVQGTATALSGPAVSDAIVKYSVSRSSYRPWWRRWSGYYPTGNTTIIETGESVTDKDGVFAIDFVASYPANQGGLYYNYTISVDITDSNGETRSTSKTLSVSSKAVHLTTSVPEILTADRPLAVELSATNFAGQAQDVVGQLIIHSLDEPTSYDYSQDKPSRYGGPTSKHYASWPVLAEVVRQPFDTALDKSPAIEDLAAGTYRLSLVSPSADTFETHFVVVDYAAIRHSPARLLYHQLDQATYQPGDIATLSVAVSDEVEVYYLIEKRDGSTAEWLPLRGSTATVRVPIVEGDRGSIYYKLLCVSHNRYFVEGGVISVPFSNKQLTVELETWRDKILPGAEEEWTLKIKGPRGDQVAAEVLAAMYDASLDQFTGHSWQTSFWQSNASKLRASAFDFNMANVDVVNGQWNSIDYIPTLSYQIPYLVWSGANQFIGSRSGGDFYYIDGVRPSVEVAAYDTNLDEASTDRPSNRSRTAMSKMTAMNIEADVSTEVAPASDALVVAEVEVAPAPVIRSDFRETVFFYPDLRTDADGSVAFTFKMSEALTKWRSMFLAHTQDLKTGYTEQYVQTQKDLMIVGNSPRFLRAGDRISLTGKVSNLSKSSISGKARIRLVNALTEEALPFVKSTREQSFSLDQGGNTTLAWDVEIPRDFVAPVSCEIVAQAGDHNDGERHLLPTVTNRKLVTETMPMFVQGGQSQGFVFERLKDATSSTLAHQLYAVEFTSNPLWYVLQALPTLEPKSLETSDYVAQRLYASLVGQHIVQLSPKVKQIFDQWQSAGSDALLSNLEKNQALKTTILNETPWVRDAADETMQKRMIAAFFDVNALASSQASILRKLRLRQRPDGGFPWCDGGQSNATTTQRILLILGQLQELQLLPRNGDIDQVLAQAHRYHDEALKEQYDGMTRQSGFRADDNHLSSFAIRYIQVQTLLGRTDQGVATDAYQYYRGQITQYWLSRPLTEQAVIGQVLFSLGDKEVTGAIVESLRQFSISSPEMGMYWDQRGYQWSRLPVERQTEMIRLFALMERDDEIAQQTLHLLQLKKTNRWPTSAATTAAVHTFLTQGPVMGEWLSATEPVDVEVGGQDLNTTAAEAGTLYVKETYESVTPQLANVVVNNPNTGVAWGAAYWQYWEDLDKITSFDDTPLKVTKTYYKKVKSSRGDILQPVTTKEVLNLGDQLVSRITIETDRPMSFVHMQDMRPAGVEPVDVLSAYTYRDGLVYYHASRDLSTDLYIDYLPKGKHVIEYDVFVSHAGDFSTGIATLQSYYAPEYNSHSQGSRINVE